MSESLGVFLDGIFIAATILVTALFVITQYEGRKKPVVETIKSDEALHLWLNQVRAEAWEEGYTHCFDCEANDETVSLNENPYRQGETE